MQLVSARPEIRTGFISDKSADSQGAQKLSADCCESDNTFCGILCYCLGMRNPAGVHPDAVALEQRLRKAAELSRQGIHHAGWPAG
jgi:hypothetical protein